MKDYEWSKCGKVKAKDEFNYSRQKIKAGYMKYRGYCKECNRSGIAEYIKKHKERYIEHNKRWRKENRERYLKTMNEGHKAYNYRNPEKITARNVAARNRDKIIGSNCEYCSTANCLEMHHPDYMKPLEVITLCRKCHRKEDKAHEQA